MVLSYGSLSLCSGIVTSHEKLTTDRQPYTFFFVQLQVFTYATKTALQRALLSICLCGDFVILIISLQQVNFNLLSVLSYWNDFFKGLYFVKNSVLISFFIFYLNLHIYTISLFILFMRRSRTSKLDKDRLFFNTKNGTNFIVFKNSTVDLNNFLYKLFRNLF